MELLLDPNEQACDQWILKHITKHCIINKVKTEILLKKKRTTKLHVLAKYLQTVTNYLNKCYKCIINLIISLLLDIKIDKQEWVQEQSHRFVL